MSKIKTLPARVQSLPMTQLQSVQPGSWRTSGQTAAARGYDYRWQKMRARHLTAHPFCVMCLRELAIVAREPAAVIVECATRGIRVPYGNVVDHIVPHRGREALLRDPGNLQTLCVAHHSGTKQRIERSATRRGFAVDDSERGSNGGH